MARAARLRGLRSEVLLGLGLVMLTATAVLTGLGLRLQDAQLAQLRELAARQLVTDVQRPIGLPPGPEGGEWWWIDGAGAAEAWGAAGPVDVQTLELAAAARAEGGSLLQAGAPWEPLRLAMPVADRVVAMRLPAAAGLPLLLGLVLGSVTVFTGFGASVLRGRVVAPLQRLALGVRSAAEGDLAARLPEEGVRETAEVARAFNELAEALEKRTHALEKAVTDLRESNRRLRAARDGLDRAERLAAVGHLASGVAHEVGNPVGALLALLDLLGREPGLSDAGREQLRKAQQQGERVRAILRELLDFSRPSRGQASAVDLGELAHATFDLVRPQRRYAGIDFQLQLEPDAPRAWADASAVSQALLNLVLNAADAVLEAGRGRVTVAVRPAARSARSGESGEAASQRRRPDAVELVVEDDGPGVAAEDRERIFDPFYTTKDPGLGTGLGLSNALRVAEQQGGRLDLAESAPGSGARFLLTLPAADGAGGGAEIREGG